MKRSFHITKNHGFCLETMRGSNEAKYLCLTIWYLRSPRRLGYLYRSLRISI